MSDPTFAEVKIGVHKKTWAPIYYVEARVSPESPWRLVTDGKKYLFHRSERAATRSARSLNRRLLQKWRAEK